MNAKIKRNVRKKVKEMANEQNLRPPTTEEARERGRKGGKASAKKRREQKTFRELFNSFLNQKTSNEKIKIQLEDAGIKDEDITNKTALMYSMVIQALKGDTKAFEIIRDTSGEQIVSKVENINPPQIMIERPKEK